MNTPATQPCHSPYCECERDKCTHPGFHDARHLASPLLWRSRDGSHQAPKTMETRHLFYTVRMIWNHTMPVQAQTATFKRYAFGPRYTKEYMLEAIRVMVPELGTRTDLTPGWTAELQQMVDWLAGQQLTQPETNTSIA